MKSNSINNITFSAFLSAILMPLAGSVMAAPPDDKGDGTGWCDGLDPSRNLYSTCIQAHSAANRLEHLQSKNASANAASKAQAALDEAIAQYAELGGGVVPGFEPPVAPCPCWTPSELSTLGVVTLNCGDANPIGVSGGFVLNGWTEAHLISGHAHSYATEYEQANTAHPDVSGVLSPGCAYLKQPAPQLIVNPITDDEYIACRDQIIAECANREL